MIPILKKCISFLVCKFNMHTFARVLVLCHYTNLISDVICLGLMKSVL